MSELIVTTPAPHVAHLRLNRPEARNALNLALRERIAEEMLRANADPGIRAIIVGGDDKAFAAGADLRELQELDAVGALARRAPELMRPVAESRKPVIAAVRGFAFGGGFELALACDILVAGEGARLALPEVKVGVMPGGGGTQRLSRVVGKQRAMLLALTGRAISGREAGEMGIASAVVADAEVEPAALSIACEIAALPPIGVQMIKEAILRGADQPLDAALAFERRSFQFLFATDDRAEGIAAFFGKRAPEFRGR
ncbi:MAG: enoyl-CoA hydratase [Alphaproteobacteria bacterium]|nr:enoyl-CoA hydratase [Alphaproteobacteria bacterium]